MTMSAFRGTFFFFFFYQRSVLRDKYLSCQCLGVYFYHISVFKVTFFTMSVFRDMFLTLSQCLGVNFYHFLISVYGTILGGLDRVDTLFL